MLRIAVNRFKDFLKEQYPLYEFSLNNGTNIQDDSQLVRT